MSGKQAKNLTITTTGDNLGKTSITLGLTSYFSNHLPSVGFLKPLSWNTITKGNRTVDRDTLLIDRVCPVHCHIEDMNPVTLKGGFPEESTSKGRIQKNRTQVRQAHERVSEDKDLVVIEGAGNAAAGESMGLSTASLAGMFDSKVILISGGGIGQPIDEILLNKEYFKAHGCDVIGTIFNKVYPDEGEKVETIARRLLKNHDIPILGWIPYMENLYEADLMQVVETLNARILQGEKHLSRKTGEIRLGAMTSRHAMDYFQNPMFLITPGDRQDLIFAALTAHLMSKKDPERKFELRGLMLTGGLMPHENTMDLINRTDVPVMMVESDSYTTAKQMNDMKVSINHRDKDKINQLIDLVQERVDCDEILNALGLEI